MQKNKTMIQNNEAGFTLLEIIAVLVIMSILAVVAVPKYFDLQEKAREKAMQTAVAEVVSRVNGHFAKAVLGGSTPGGISYTTDNLEGDNMGDFSFEIDSIADGNITFTVTGLAEAVKDITKTDKIPVPGRP